MPKPNPRALRKRPTDAESLLWLHLRNRTFSNYKFRRQHPLGRYVVDFFCEEKEIVIEVDGSQHAEITVDSLERERWLKMKGYKVLRFWNNQILNETGAVLEVILQACVSPSP